MAGFELTAWHGIAVRSGTPAPVVQKLNATFLAIFKDPAFRKKWEALGTPVVAGTPEQFGAFVKSELAKYEKVVKASGAKLD